MISHFRHDRLPVPKVFYERQLGKLSRPNRRGYSQGRCPFHQSKGGKSFSANLTTGSFTCFGCGARGSSIVSFVMLRDNVSFKTACQSLGCWDSAPSPETVRKMEHDRRERDRHRELDQARKEDDRRRSLQLREQLHAASWAYNLVNARLSELRAGAMPDWPTEQEDCWSTLAVTLRDQRSLDAEYCAAAGLEPCE